jgi:response regulator of citrate/malate metabolism
MPEVDVDELLVATKQALMTAEEHLLERVKELEDDLAAAKREHKRIEKALDYLNGTKKNAAQKIRQGHHVKPKNADAVLEFLKDGRGAMQEDWTATQLAEAMGVHNSTIGKALKWLRDSNDIRATRSVRGGGHAYAAWKE